MESDVYTITGHCVDGTGPSRVVVSVQNYE